MGELSTWLSNLRRPLGALPKARSGRISSTGVCAALQPQPDWVTLRRQLREGPRDLASVARYDETDLPLEELNYINKDTMVVFGWLASRAFYLWQQSVLQTNPRATTLQAYNSFPVPNLQKKDRASLEEAARAVLLSRSYLMEGSLTDLYVDLPQQLAWAHSELDATVDKLLGIPDTADDKKASTVLLKAFQTLAA